MITRVIHQWKGHWKQHVPVLIIFIVLGFFIGRYCL